MDENNRLPKYTYKHFWEIDPSKLDVSQYSHYVIVRLLEYGDIPELRWLFSRFSKNQIIEILKSSRSFSRHRAASWANYFDIPQSEIRCLKKLYQNQLDAIWPY